MKIFKFIIISTMVISDVFCGELVDEIIDEKRQHMSIQEKMKLDMELIKNYTEELKQDSMSCEEFVKNYTFDVSKIIDVYWNVFYFWTTDYRPAFSLTFSLATKLLVDRYRVELNKTLKEPVVWKDALLFMETSHDFSGLFIKTKTDGIFQALPSLMFHDSMPILPYAVKYVEPYLALINCKYRLGYAFAPPDKMPQDGKNAEEAEKIGFRCPHGQSLDLPYHIDVPQIVDRPESHDDDNEDLHFEYERQINEERLSILM